MRRSLHAPFAPTLYFLEEVTLQVQKHDPEVTLVSTPRYTYAEACARTL